MAVQNQKESEMSAEKEVMLRYFLGRRIVLPKCDDPEVTIVIPVYNQYFYTIACLQSLVCACSGKTTYEVILADDGSTDETSRIAEHVENLRIVHNATGKHGFLPNVNNAAQAARGKYLFLLNNDTLLLDAGGLLDNMTSHFECSDVGVVGCQLLRTDGSLYDCGRIVVSLGALLNLRPPANNVISFESDMVEGSAMMVRMKTWREFGGFDTIYERGYYEESDFCFKVKALKNQRVISDMRCKIIHFAQRTFEHSSDTDALFFRNGKIFMDRWHDYLVSREAGIQANNHIELATVLYNRLYANSK